MKSLGINIGSSSLKVVLHDDGNIISHRVIPHDGDFTSAITRIVEEENIPDGVPTLITGTEGRFLFSINNAIALLARNVHIKGSRGLNRIASSRWLTDLSC